jgi:hypothetical protein
MFDQNSIKSANDLKEVLSAVAQRVGNVLENETSIRIATERKEAERNAITELLKRMEQLSHISVTIDLPGSHEEKIARRQRTALMVRDLLTNLDEFAKGKQTRQGSSEFSADLIAAIYFGHEIFMACEGDRRDLMKYLPVSQPAAAPAPALVIDAGAGTAGMKP